MISVTDLRAGAVFEEKGQYFLVISYEHSKIARGSGNVKVKVRNLETGATIEKTFNTGAKVADANLTRKKTQYLYRDNQGFHFMDPVTYEQFSVDRKLVEDVAKYLKEGVDLTLLAVDDNPVGVEIPKIMEYKIVQTGGSARGNTAGSAQKDAVLETNLVVKVPLFVKSGEVIRVDTRTGQYVERAK